MSGPGALRLARLLAPLAPIVALLGAPAPSVAEGGRFEPGLLGRIEARYGKAARARLEQLTALLVAEEHGTSDMEKLVKVNDFFNRVPFVDDPKHWNSPDYWATPVEKLATNGGDCEDFSIAKYFALKRLGIPDSKLRLTYVKSIPLEQAHMVTTYFPEPGAVPLVLDNLDPRILPANERRDLIPVYSFNGDGLWLAKSRGTGKRVGNSDKVKGWRDVMRRMDGLDL